MADGSASKRQPGRAREPASLASVIREAREAAGLSMRQLAPLVGLHHSVLARIEAGEVTKPSPETVQNIAEALEIDPSELLEFIGVELPAPRVYFRRAYGMTAEETEEAIRLIEGLRDDRKQKRQRGQTE